MKYCRYCANCITSGDCYYCDEREIVLSYTQIRRPTLCSDFYPSCMGDVDTGKMYRPKKRKSVVRDVGVSLF